MADAPTAYLTIGHNIPGGGTAMTVWAISEDDAERLTAEFRDRIGEPDAEAMADGPLTEMLTQALDDRAIIMETGGQP